MSTPAPARIPWDHDDGPVGRAGKALYDARAAYMVACNVGLTETYNRLKDPHCTDAEVIHLRQLHERVDRAVLDAYGWTDIAVPPYCPLTDADKRAVQAFEDEVIDRLYVLNAQRAEEERVAREAREPKAKRARAPKAPPPPPPPPTDELAALRADIERLTQQRFRQRIRADGAEDDANRLAAGLEAIAAGHPDPRERARQALHTDELWGYRHELRAARDVCRRVAGMLAKGESMVDGELVEAVQAWLRLAGRTDRPNIMSRYDVEETSSAK